MKGTAKPTATASEPAFGKYGRSIAGDVESPSLLPLLLLPLPSPPLPPLLLLLLLLQLPQLLQLAAAAAAAVAATAVSAACCCRGCCCCGCGGGGGGGGYRFKCRSHLSRDVGRRWSSTQVCWFGVGDASVTADGVRSRIIPGTSITQNSSKSQFLDAVETASNWRQF